MQTDDATTGGLTEAIETLLPALEHFLRWTSPERTARERAVWSAQLDEPLPQTGAGAEAVLTLLRDVVIPNGVRLGAPGFSGWVATMPTTLPAAANFAAVIAGSAYQCIQAFNLLEAQALHWLAELVGLPSTYQGLFTSGGSVANLVGLGAARQHAAERLGVDPARDGIEALPHPRIYASTEVHHVIYRAAAVLGLGRRAVVHIPTDEALRLDVAALHARLRQDQAAGCTPIAVVANAGTVNTGAIDPLPELGELCQEQGIWLHVDGAYGLLGVLDPRTAPLYGDLRVADSLVLDPHKWLAAPIGCGAVFVRDGKLLGRAFTLESAAYVEESQPVYAEDAPLTCQFDDFGYLFHHFGVEQSAPSRGVQVWAILKEIGAEGVRARICRHNGYARHLAERVQSSPCLELMAPVILSICCFRYVPPTLRGRTDDQAITILNQLNREVLARVRARGRCIPSATTVHGAFVIRPCYINPRTTLADVDALVEEVESCGAEAWQAH
ncbi:MAG TPA: aminotransferase class V-fold PLP-dependent enzyme [Ktedonobacteraceae bacterium]|nr:aminotransferase class V-fold PLP-dependent enzyme [Ktedonobacteraceae bacterium]